VRKLALTDLYKLRRYAAKLRFEVDLYQGDARQKTDIATQGRHYARLLTQATGFKYDPDLWLEDLDPGFYVADYFTAWTLEAQLKDHLERTYGTPEAHGEDWYKIRPQGTFSKHCGVRGIPTRLRLPAPSVQPIPITRKRCSRISGSA
jgi:hypothetical protein